MKVVIDFNSISEENVLLVRSIDSLEMLVSDGEADEILSRSTLSYFPTRSHPEVLKRIIAKLKVGGTLTLIEPSIFYIKNINTSIAQANELFDENRPLYSFCDPDFIVQTCKDLAISNACYNDMSEFLMIKGEKSGSSAIFM